MGYRVLSSAGLALRVSLFNMNLDRSIQSFSVPLGAGVNVSNSDFMRHFRSPDGQTMGRRRRWL